MLDLFLTCGLAAVIGGVLTGIAKVLFQRLALLDKPGSEAHKQHTASVPYGGGLALCRRSHQRLCHHRPRWPCPAVAFSSWNSGLVNPWSD